MSTTRFQNSKIPEVLQKDGSLIWGVCDVGVLHLQPKGLDQITCLGGSLLKKTGILEYPQVIHILARVSTWFIRIFQSYPQFQFGFSFWNLFQFFGIGRVAVLSLLSLRKRRSSPIPKFQNLVPKFQFSGATLESWNFTIPWTTK